jgi:glycine/D-amino acid oxidase-like deaminating enzyme
VLTGLKHSAAELLRAFGKERARALYAASVQSIACVESIIAEERIDCDYTRCGHLAAAARPAHYESFKRAQEALARDFDHPTRLVPRADMLAELGTSFYHGVLVDERSGGLHPARYVNGLALAAERAGADLHENTPAAQIAKAPGGFVVRTERGEIQCKDLLVATNGYTGGLTPALQRRIIPLGSYIIATEPLGHETARRLIPHRRMVFDTKHFLFYFRLSPDNRMVFGGRAAFFPATPGTVRRSAEILRRDMIKVFPELSRAQIAYAWGGTVAFTFDLYPHAGRMEGMWYAMGYAGHGVALATYLGQQIADRILGQGGDNPFEELPFPSVPLYRGNPWFLPFAAAWYRFLDIVA